MQDPRIASALKFIQHDIADVVVPEPVGPGTNWQTLRQKTLIKRWGDGHAVRFGTTKVDWREMVRLYPGCFGGDRYRCSEAGVSHLDASTYTHCPALDASMPLHRHALKFKLMAAKSVEGTQTSADPVYLIGWLV